MQLSFGLTTATTTTLNNAVEVASWLLGWATTQHVINERGVQWRIYTERDQSRRRREARQPFLASNKRFVLINHSNGNKTDGAEASKEINRMLIDIAVFSQKKKRKRKENNKRLS